MAKILISTGIDELVEAGRRFGSEWARLREFLKKRGEKTEKWFDNMIIKLDSPTAEGFHRIIRKMVRTFYDYQGVGLKWNISSEVLSLLSDRSKISLRHAFMTGVFFGYYGYFEKPDEKEEKDE
jgi:pyruvate carboxylase